MGGPTGAREIGPHRGEGGKREKAISPGRGGAGEEIVNAHLSLGLEIIPIVHRNYDGWTIRWSLPARRPTRDHEFASDFLRRRACAPSDPRRRAGSPPATCAADLECRPAPRGGLRCAPPRERPQPPSPR